MKRVYRSREEGDIGIATLILFIAIIIVAAIASSLIIYVGVTLREQGEKVATDAVAQITSSLRVLNILGDRDVNGMSPDVIGCRAPSTTDYTPPHGGRILNVTVNSTSPLSVRISWVSAADSGSGMAREEIYRLNGSYAGVKYLLNNLDYVKNNGKLIATLTSGFGNRSYVDFTVAPDSTYSYAIIGYDHAGNAVLYAADNQSIAVPSGSPDTTPPSGSLSSIQVSGYGVILTWQASDSGSGIAEQIVYRSREPVSSGTLGNATVVAKLNGTARTCVDYPPAPGTWYYGVLGIDRAGNSAIYSATQSSVNISAADLSPPAPVSGLRASPGYSEITLTWAPSRDPESGVKYYEIYRSSDYSVITSESLLNSTPYAVTTGTEFRDYSYTPFHTYYYAVIAVNGAGAKSPLVYPQSTIQILEIKLALGPGSQPVDFNSVLIEITDGSVDATLKLNTSGFGVNASDSKHYSVSVLNDPSGEFTKNYVLGDGAVVKVYINAGALGMSLTPQTTVKMKIIPGPGVPIYQEFVVPSIMLNRYVQIY